MSGKLQASAALSPGNNPVIHGLGRCVGPTAVLDDSEKKRSVAPVEIQTLHRPARSLVNYNDRAFPTLLSQNRLW
jgi:hypothetical protein